MFKNRLALANVVAFIVLLSNYFAPGWVTVAYADPPSQPATGPVSGDFFTGTWQSTQQTLFGSTTPGQETAFYRTASMITGVGQYAGFNNIGQPVILTVIRHYVQNDQKFSTEMSTTEIQQRENSGQQRGVFWGTVAGPSGSVNIIGASMAWTEAGTTTSGFVPVINHDALAAFYVPDDPSTQEDNFTFTMMSESWNPNQQSVPPEPCMMCMPPAQGMWCPDQDPWVIAARENLKACLAVAAANLALEVAGAVAALALATKLCLATVEPLSLSACLGIVLTGALIGYAIALARFMIAVAACMNAYENSFNAAMAAACPQP